MNKSFRIIPLPTKVAETARRIAAAGQSDHRMIVADSPASYPCRHCLRWAEPGQAMILFPHQSIPAHRPYAESGPIFVHKEACEQYSAADTYPDAFRHGRAIRAYNSDDEIIAAEIPAANPEGTFAAMFASPEISFLQVRSLTHGCYTMKVERA